MAAAQAKVAMASVAQATVTAGVGAVNEEEGREQRI